MPLEPGQVLAHYRIERRIGQGGMGTVYLAVDTRLDRKVALKVLPPEMASDAARLERFRREAKAVAALNHPHIVTIHSVEEEGGTHFLTMELAEGESLDHGIPPGGLPLAKVFDVGIALADALAAAHEKGIIHRDLKPANVMVAKDGRVKVLDFGLAKLTAEPGTAGAGAGAADATSAPTEMARRDDSLTAAGLVMGTIPYMSPEQVGGEPVDARTDVFSLGVVLYELATGRRPFGGKNPAQTISSILRDAARPVTEARQDAPRHLGRIIEHCLEKDPEARFQTAKDVRNELRDLRKEMESGASAATRHPSAPSRVTPDVSPASAASAAPVPAPIPTPSGATTATAVSRPWLWAAGGAVAVLAVVGAFWLGGRRGGVPGPPDAPATPPMAATRGAGAATVTETNSIAVLPFTNMSPDKDQEYFSDGLTEELLNALVKIPDLKVAGRTSSFSFKGRNEDLRTIGEKLGVANILEGSVRKSGDKVRITAQLVKAADGFHLWSETYDRTLDDIFAVQDDIAREVAAALKVTLLGRGADAPKRDAEAYDLVLQAHFVMQSRAEADIIRARTLLDRALHLSPDYAPAWAEMGLAHYRGLEIATTVEARQQASERAREALARSLELDPGLALAHSRIAVVQLDSWDFAAMERSTARALAADPKNPIVMGNAALAYGLLGRMDEAIALHERVLEADPLNIAQLVNLSNIYMMTARFDAAEALSRKVLQLAPDQANAHAILGDIHLARGEVEEARRSHARAAELSGTGDYGRLTLEALVEHTAGNTAASQAAAAEFEKRFGAEDPASAAQIRAWRGETDAAFAWLDKALAARDPGLTRIKLDFYLSSLHADPRWNALLKRIGLPID